MSRRRLAFTLVIAGACNLAGCTYPGHHLQPFSGSRDLDTPLPGRALVLFCLP
jgi:hypothetical protein